MQIAVSVQDSGFDVAAEYAQLRRANTEDGAAAMFVGSVRDFSATPEGGKRAVAVMELEHYPGMAERALRDIAEQAGKRWPLGRVRVVHRYGALAAGDDIVFVGITSAHRQASLDACAFIMDFLKSRAPFWKKELGQDGEQNGWVEARSSDEQALKKW